MIKPPSPRTEYPLQLCFLDKSGHRFLLMLNAGKQTELTGAVGDATRACLAGLGYRFAGQWDLDFESAPPVLFASSLREGVNVTAAARRVEDLSDAPTSRTYGAVLRLFWGKEATKLLREVKKLPVEQQASFFPGHERWPVLEPPALPRPAARKPREPRKKPSLPKIGVQPSVGRRPPERAVHPIDPLPRPKRNAARVLRLPITGSTPLLTGPQKKKAEQIRLTAGSLRSLTKLPSAATSAHQPKARPHRWDAEARTYFERLLQVLGVKLEAEDLARVAGGIRQEALACCSEIPDAHDTEVIADASVRLVIRLRRELNLLEGVVQIPRTPSSRVLPKDGASKGGSSTS